MTKLETLRNFFQLQLCKFGIHDKRTGARVKIRGNFWYVTYEYRCRRCCANLGEKQQYIK
jgi:hypothetical protein